jgi:hypothetical protein
MCGSVFLWCDARQLVLGSGRVCEFWGGGGGGGQTSYLQLKELLKLIKKDVARGQEFSHLSSLIGTNQDAAAYLILSLTA